MNEGLAAVDDVLEAEARLLFADGGRMPITDYTALPQTTLTKTSRAPATSHAAGSLPASLLRVHDSVALEVEIRSSITLREEYLARLYELCGPEVSPTELQQNLLDAIGIMDLLRSITVEIVEQITRWRRGLPRPFPWQGARSAKTSYLMKISNDTKFLAHHSALEGWLGMSLAHNPFFALNVKCRRKAAAAHSNTSGGTKASRKLLLASFQEDRLQAVEDAIRREEIHNGMVHRGEIGGVPVDILGGMNGGDSGEGDVNISKEPERDEFDDLIAMESRMFFQKNEGDESATDMNASTKDASARISAREILLADRVRRKLTVISKRPKLRAKLVRLAQTNEQQLKAGQRRKKGLGASLRIGKRFRGSKKSRYSVGRSSASNSGGEGGGSRVRGGLGQEELRQLLFRNAGTKFDTVEWKWLMGRLDPKRTGRIWAEDLVSLVDLAPKNVKLFYYDAEGGVNSGGEDNDANKKWRKNLKSKPSKRDEVENDDAHGGRLGEDGQGQSQVDTSAALLRAEEAAAVEAKADQAERDFIPDVKRRRRKHTKREMEQIELLEEELEGLLDANRRTEEELEWWRTQHEWQDATTHSVATRRTKLAKAEREIAKRQKTGKSIRLEIKARRDQLQKIRDRTKKSRKAIAEQQRLKALWFQYGSRKKYEEHLAWEEEKEALRQALAEKYERDRLAKLAREKRRAEDREKRLRLRNIAALEIQRIVRGRRGRGRAKRRRTRRLKQARTREELERRRAVRIQGLFRSKRDRRKVASRRSKRRAAVRLQSLARGRADRTTRLPLLRAQARKKTLLACAAFRADPSNFLRPLNLWVEQQRQRISRAQINQARPVFDHSVTKQLQDGRSQDVKASSGMSMPNARQAIIFVSHPPGKVKHSTNYVFARMRKQLRNFLGDGIDHGFKLEMIDRQRVLYEVPWQSSSSPKVKTSSSQSEPLHDAECQKRIVQALSEGRSVIIPVDVGISAIRRVAFISQVQGLLKIIHAQRVKLRREMLSRGQMGIFDALAENQEGSRLAFKSKGCGPADLFDHVDPFVFLVCGEQDLGRIGSGKDIIAAKQMQNQTDESNQRGVRTDINGTSTSMHEEHTVVDDEVEEDYDDDEDDDDEEEDDDKVDYSARDWLEVAASTLWSLPLSLGLSADEEVLGNGSAITQILTPKKERDSTVQIHNTADAAAPNSLSPAQIGEHALLHLMKLLEERHGSNRSSVVSAADSGTRAPSMAETIQMNEYATELMILECLAIMLHPSNIEDFEGPWPSYPDSVMCSQKAIAATLKKIMLMHQLKHAKFSEHGIAKRQELVLLPKLKSMLEKVDLFELSRNKKSSTALHRYVNCARWDINGAGNRSRSPSAAQHQASALTPKTIQQNESKVKPDRLCVVFRILHKFVSEVSGLLDDLNDHGASSTGRATDGSLSGGAPAQGIQFQPGPVLEGDSKLFDHIYLCRDVEGPSTAPGTPVAPSDNLQNVQTPNWYHVACNIFLAIITGKHAHALNKNNTNNKSKKSKSSTAGNASYKCLRRAPVLPAADSLSIDAIKPSSSHGPFEFPSSPASFSNSKLETDAVLGRVLHSYNLGVRVYRSVLQSGSGTFISVIVVHVESLAPASHFERVLVLREDGFTPSNHSDMHAVVCGTNRDTELLARLVAPHVSSTGNASHNLEYMAGRTNKPFVPLALKSVAAETDMLARLSETVCLTWEGFKPSVISIDQEDDDIKSTITSRGVDAARTLSSASPKKQRKKQLQSSRQTRSSMAALSPDLLPRIVLKRSASLLLSAKVRMADIRAPSSVGQMAHCRTWEGASGEIILEARFVNSASDGSSSKGGILRSFRTTWQALRRLSGLPFFASGMRTNDREAVDFGEMKSLSWFLLSRIAFDGQLLRLSAFNVEDASLPHSSSSSSSFSSSEKQSEISWPRAQLMNAMLPINDETSIRPLVHPVLATAEGVLIVEASSKRVASASVQKTEDTVELGEEKIGQGDTATSPAKVGVFIQRKARQQRVVFVSITRDNTDGSVADNRSGRTMYFWIHVLLLHPSKDRGDTIQSFAIEAAKAALPSPTSLPVKSPSKSRSESRSPSNSRNKQKKAGPQKISHWMSLRVSHTELARASAVTVAMSSVEQDQFFRNPFWASETVLSAQNAGAWLEIVRLDDMEVLRRVRAAQAHTSSGQSGPKAYPPDLVWSLRLKRVKLPEVKPPPRKRQDILMPMHGGRPMEIGITARKHRSMQRGIRITTVSQRVKIYEDYEDAIKAKDESAAGVATIKNKGNNGMAMKRTKRKKKKKKKGIMCMVSVYDEGPGPPAAPSVMRIECLHPASGELVRIRIGPSGLKRVADASNDVDKLRSGFRNDIAILLMQCLRLRISDTPKGQIDESPSSDRRFHLVFVISGVAVGSDGDSALQASYDAVDDVSEGAKALSVGIL